MNGKVAKLSFRVIDRNNIIKSAKNQLTTKMNQTSKRE